VIARTTWGRALAVGLSVGLAQIAVPAVHAAPPAPGGEHLVNPEQVARRLIENARTREERIKLFQDALAAEPVRQQARAMGADPDRLRAAVPHLTDRELADLAARAEQVKDVAAGHRRHDGTAALIIVGALLLVAGIAVLAVVAHNNDWDDDYWEDDCWCY
jgi:uncharacterized protein YjiS (DUF1127 family)